MLTSHRARSFASSPMSDFRTTPTFSCHCQDSTTCSAASAISTPMTMIPTSPTSARQPCSGLGRWRCTWPLFSRIAVRRVAFANRLFARRGHRDASRARRRNVVRHHLQAKAIEEGLELRRPSVHAPVDVACLLQRVGKLKLHFRGKPLEMLRRPQSRPFVLFYCAFGIHVVHVRIHAAVEREILGPKQGRSAGLG